MKAIRFHEYGDIDVLRYEETPTPRPGRGEALVSVAATAFNPVDTWFRAGIIDQIFPVRFPHTLGLDLAGTVVEHGPGVDDPAIGTEVIGFLPMTGPGAAAEYVNAPAELLVRAPADIPLIDAAAIPVPTLTAWQALFEHGNLVAGQRVLVNGAGGGVGGFVVQLAKQAGATVIATASPRSADAVRAAGADHVIDYTAAKIADALDAPIDLAINLFAGTSDNTADLLNVIAPSGTLGDGDLTRWGISRTHPAGGVFQRTQRHDPADPHRRTHRQRTAPPRHQRPASPVRHRAAAPTKRGRRTARSHSADPVKDVGSEHDS